MKKSLRGNLQAFLPRVHLLRCRNIKWAKGECVLNQIVFAAGVLLFPAVCTTLGAAGVFLLRRSAAPRTQRVLSGMAAGIMLAASVWSLLLPAIERTRELGVAAWVPPSAGLVLGAAGLLRLESMAGQLSVIEYYTEADAVYRNLQAYMEVENQYQKLIAALYKHRL